MCVVPVPDRDELRENGGVLAAGEELPQVRWLRDPKRNLLPLSVVVSELFI